MSWDETCKTYRQKAEHVLAGNPGELASAPQHVPVLAHDLAYLLQQLDDAEQHQEQLAQLSARRFAIAAVRCPRGHDHAIRCAEYDVHKLGGAMLAHCPIGDGS